MRLRDGKGWLVAMGLLMTSLCWAGEGSGRVRAVTVHPSAEEGVPVIMFELENHAGQPAACPGTGWAFRANDAYGLSMYALLLSASARDKGVFVKGAGDCAAWADRERPLFMIMIN